MRLYKVVILVNLALGVGLLSGYLWWERDVDRLRRELNAARQSAPVRPGGEKSGFVRGIVRAVLPKDGSILITHEPLSGPMGSMTTSFRLRDPSLMKGIEPGDRVQFTPAVIDNQLVVVTLHKERQP